MAEYKKLAHLIANNKAELCKQLKDLSLPSDSERIKHLCVEYVGGLTRKDAEYMTQLSLLEQDILSPVLKVIDILYSSDIELNGKVNSLMLTENVEQRNNKTCTKGTITKEYGPALVGVAGGTLLATICKPSSWGIILFGSVISAIIGKVLYSLYVDKNDNVIAEVGDAKLPEHHLTSDDINNVINGLVTAGECIDRVLLTYRRHLDIMHDEYKHKIATFKLDKKYIGILECYQTILGNLFSMENTPIVQDTIKQINNSLSNQGYKAVHYTEGLENLFDIKIGIVEHLEEFKPAILKIDDEKETLVLKGDIVLPE